MTTEQILAALTGPAFVASCTALLRKFAPSIDGKVVLAVVMALASITTIVTMCAASIPSWGWAIIAAVVTAVTAAGGTEWASRIAGKVASPPASGDLPATNPSDPRL